MAGNVAVDPIHVHLNVPVGVRGDVLSAANTRTLCRRVSVDSWPRPMTRIVLIGIGNEAAAFATESS
jgi:hypothetical protein